MRKWILLAVMGLSVSGCVVEPSPYYGGSAPYYGTSIAPAYVGVGVYGSSYPYYANRHVYSRYNNDYWHNQAHANFHSAAGAHAVHADASHGGGFHGGEHEGEHR